MAKNILIAFDDSENAMRAVDFVACHLVRDASVTLYSILQDTESMCAMNSPELTPYFKTQQQSFCSLEDKKHQIIEKALKVAQNRLIEAGFDQERVNVKAKKSANGVAGEIIREADSGYDVVVIGKRGTSAVQEFFFGSVSQKVMQGVKIASVLSVI
ncbi:MAG: universal stress protein [Desulfobacteraceae bacterium]|nr:MAG: universal stress protein [Desulfobacteraceae bacterium]